MKLKDVWMNFGTKPEGSWIIGQQDAWILYQLIQKYPIKKVLDLGTGIGCSASVMAQALLDKGEKDFKITGIEQFEKCAKLAEKYIPEDLKKFIDVKLIPTEVWHSSNIPYLSFSTYKEIPKDEYDLILVDGPGMWQEGECAIELPNGDVMKLLEEGRLKKGTLICWDERIEALKLVERFYSDNFMVTNPNTHFNFLEVKDEKAKFDDYKLKTAKISGYF